VKAIRMLLIEVLDSEIRLLQGMPVEYLDLIEIERHNV